MALYERTTGWRIEITDLDTSFVEVRGERILEYWIKAVFNDHALSERLNGQPVWSGRWQKTFNVLVADGGKEEILKECENYFNV